MSEPDALKIEVLSVLVDGIPVVLQLEGFIEPHEVFKLWVAVLPSVESIFMVALNHHCDRLVLEVPKQSLVGLV